MTDLTKWMNIITEGVEPETSTEEESTTCDCSDYDCKKCFPAKNESTEEKDESIEETIDVIGEDDCAITEDEATNAYAAGKKDAESGKPRRNASDMFGPFAGDYGSGYSAGKKASTKKDPSNLIDEEATQSPEQQIEQHLIQRIKSTTRAGMDSDASELKALLNILRQQGMDAFIKTLPKTFNDIADELTDFFPNLAETDTDDDYQEQPSTKGYDVTEPEVDSYDDSDYERVKGSLQEADCARCGGCTFEPNSYDDCQACDGSGTDTMIGEPGCSDCEIDEADDHVSIEIYDRIKNHWQTQLGHPAQGSANNENTLSKIAYDLKTIGDCSDERASNLANRIYDELTSLDETNVDDDYQEQPSTKGYDVTEPEVDSYDDSDYERVKGSLEEDSANQGSYETEVDLENGNSCTVVVSYEYEPGEKAELNYPGSDDEMHITSVTYNGKEVPDELFSQESIQSLKDQASETHHQEPDEHPDFNSRREESVASNSLAYDENQGGGYSENDYTKSKKKVRESADAEVLNNLKKLLG